MDVAWISACETALKVTHRAEMRPGNSCKGSEIPITFVSFPASKFSIIHGDTGRIRIVPDQPFWKTGRLP
jgi:hypothetical protein